MVVSYEMASRSVSRRDIRLTLNGHVTRTVETLWKAPALPTHDNHADVRVLVVAHLDRLSSRLDRNQFYRYEALARRPGVILFGPGREGYRPGMTVDEAIATACSGHPPDVIYHGLDFKESGAPLLEGLPEADAITVLELADSWARAERQIAFINQQRFDVVLSMVAHHIPSYAEACPHAAMLWFPNAINTELFRRYGAVKDYDIILYGNIDETAYPLRARLAKLFAAQNELRFRHIPCPPYYPPQGVETPGIIAGAALSREINRAWIGIATASIYDCLMMKHLEIAASYALVAGTIPDEARSIFRGDFLELNLRMSDAEILARFREALTDRDRLLARIDAAHRRIVREHSTGAFADRLLDLLRRLVRQTP
jgi:hypothetical protein